MIIEQNDFLYRNERFRGYQQQDSQELYHCLLDAIKTEEIKVYIVIKFLFTIC